MHTSENIKAIVKLATIDHIEDLTPYKDIEDKSAVDKELLRLVYSFCLETFRRILT